MVTFNLVNNGGTIAPGHSIGDMEVQGDLTLEGGVLEIEIASRSIGGFDHLSVQDVTTLGGMLQFRSQMLDPARNERGRISLAVAQRIIAVLVKRGLLPSQYAL